MSDATASAERELWGLRLAQLFALPLASAGPLVQRGRLRRFAPRDILAAPGRPLDELHWVLDGSVEVTRLGRAYGRAGAGDAVAAIVAWARDPIGVGAIATTTTHTLSFPADRLSTLLEGRSPLFEPSLRSVARDAIAIRRRLGASAGYVPGADAERAPDLLDPVDRMLLVRDATGGARNTRIEAIADLASVAMPVELAAGQALWRAGDARSGWCLLLASGEIIGRAREPDQTFVHRRGDAAGLLDAFAATPRWYDATVQRTASALRIERDDLLEIIGDHPALQDEMFQRMGGAALRALDR
ncbi:cyclic nucleotide-binding domain-containing protein [Sandaracinus amylolyticus]|uniref:Transcriptional regulator, Crp/Fnr family protein n=1 Tax=Sandaracinus amylolyticus TaxID=927083 RepID=A0A0F6YG66_9BACT|nr:cyclic nucleotide-binding domain-containing protein [Sandaracinus amylolyticus]AKF04391.1 transcriptional regulator, Crp/Fnr family protein [Sandaracinus amylolyticus]